jgi:triosephosphate isomerase
MRTIFVNLKRWEVPRQLGGVCPDPDPAAWMQSVIAESMALNLGSLPELELVYLCPEGLVNQAYQELEKYPAAARTHLAVGVQGVYWDDIAPGKNFGAFTSRLPATAAAHLGASWAIIGHSEERKALLQVMQRYDPMIPSDPTRMYQAARAVDTIINAEVQKALNAGLHVLMCVGESADERGAGSFEQQQPRIEAVLSAQVAGGLQDVAEINAERRIVIGYEPIWAIGPGKVPPGKEYIAFVAEVIKRTARQESGRETSVVYGGGLKEENAGMIARIEAVHGGLVGLTRFSGEIGFSVAELQKIIETYLTGIPGT